MKYTAIAAFAAALLGCAPLSAQAADLPTAKAPIFIAAAPSPWMVRVRGLAVLPQESTRSVVVGGVPLTDKISVSDTVIPELDISYFFTPNFAAELVLGTTPHNLTIKGPVTNHLALGRVWLLPPTLTLQYHFTQFGAFKPYVGAGVNYTVFYGEKSKSAFTSLDVKDQFGFALQAGMDYMLDQHWGLNIDVKKLWLRPDAKAVLGGSTPVKAKVNLDPWLVGVGVTYRF
jgi:outer membrane protein